MPPTDYVTNENVMRNRAPKKPSQRGRTTPPPPSPTRVDPTRTGTLRKVFGAHIRRQFDAVEKAIDEWVAKQDNLALLARNTTTKSDDMGTLLPDGTILIPVVVGDQRLFHKVSPGEPLYNEHRQSLERAPLAGLAALNQFCPTGKGGGIDPHCGDHDGKATGTGGSGTGSGAAASGGAGKAPSDAELSSGETTPLKPGGEVRAVKVGDKTYVVKQRADTATTGQNEVMTSDLAQIAGVNMPKASMGSVGGKPAVVQEWAKGKELAKMTKDEQKAALAKVPQAELEKQALFDYVMGHSDTHAGNYLVSQDGTFTSIDKEFTLSKGIKGQKFQPPSFLAMASQDGNDLAFKFSPESVKGMAKSGEAIAKDLEKRGMKAEARQVRDRVAVLNKLAENPNPTAGALRQLGSEGVTPPNLGLLGKAAWHLTKNEDSNAQATGVCS